MILRGSCDAMRKIVHSSVVSALLHDVPWNRVRRQHLRRATSKLFLLRPKWAPLSRDLWNAQWVCWRRQRWNTELCEWKFDCEYGMLDYFGRTLPVSSLTVINFCGCNGIDERILCGAREPSSFEFSDMSMCACQPKIVEGIENSEIHQVNSCARASDTCEISKKVVDTSALERRRDGSLNKSLTALLNSLTREWNIHQSKRLNIKFLKGKFESFRHRDLNPHSAGLWSSRDISGKTISFKFSSK